MNKRNQNMKKSTKIKIIKLIILVSLVLLITGLTIYFLPILKNLNTQEGQLQFKEKVNQSNNTCSIARRTGRGTSRNMLWNILGNYIFNVFYFYNNSINICISEKKWKKMYM